MGLGDLHCHTTASDGMASPAALVRAAVAAGLDLIVVSDHDTMAGVEEAQARGEDAGLAVVAGQEVTTRWPAQTHVLGWFLEHPVRSGRSLEETVDAIHDQGALAVIPHPFMPTYFASCQPGMLRRLIEERTVDGVELIPSAPITGGRRRALEAFYSQHRDRLGAAVGGSDSHFGRHDIGHVVTEFDGFSAEALRLGVIGRTTAPRRGRPAEIPGGLALRQQWKSLVLLPLARVRGQLE
ncbi:MAG: PHP domain-containing protein [Candidatus Dormibacteraeota bacterium]|nr:PHP domain-containing protein [Candidatus Dormibacteraeota bacterium]